MPDTPVMSPEENPPASSTHITSEKLDSLIEEARLHREANPLPTGRNYYHNTEIFADIDYAKLFRRIEAKKLQGQSQAEPQNPQS